MARSVQPCGTIAAYMRHRRAGEEPCRPCRDAQAVRQRERRAQKSRPDYRGKELIIWQPPLTNHGGHQERDSASQPDDDPFNARGDWALMDALANYQLVVTAMATTALVAPLAGLSRRRQELVDFIVKRKAAVDAAESKAQQGGGGDEFSKRRAERAARRANRRAAAAN